MIGLRAVLTEMESWAIGSEQDKWQQYMGRGLSHLQVGTEAPAPQIPSLARDKMAWRKPKRRNVGGLGHKSKPQGLQPGPQPAGGRTTATRTNGFSLEPNPFCPSFFLY